MTDEEEKKLPEDETSDASEATESSENDDEAKLRDKEAEQQVVKEAKEEGLDVAQTGHGAAVVGDAPPKEKEEQQVEEPEVQSVAPTGRRGGRRADRRKKAGATTAPPPEAVKQAEIAQQAQQATTEKTAVAKPQQTQVEAQPKAQKKTGLLAKVTEALQEIKNFIEQKFSPQDKSLLEQLTINLAEVGMKLDGKGHADHRKALSPVNTPKPTLQGQQQAATKGEEEKPKKSSPEVG